MRAVSYIVAALVLTAIAIATTILYVINFTSYFEKSKGILIKVFSYRKESLLERIAFLYYVVSNDTTLILIYNYGDLDVEISDLIIDGVSIPRALYIVKKFDGSSLGYIVPANTREPYILEVRVPLVGDLHTLIIVSKRGNSFTYKLGA